LVKKYFAFGKLNRWKKCT